MKLFKDENSKNHNKYKFKGNFTIKILKDDGKSLSSPGLSFKMQNCVLNPSSLDIDNNSSNKVSIKKEEEKEDIEVNINSKLYEIKSSQLKSTEPQSPKSVLSLKELSQVKDKIPELKTKKKLYKIHLRSMKQKKSVFNIGRWTEDEHRRFIEAILKYGNDWKNVQRHIKTRSSTQSRSHSQKFFLKIKNYDLFDFKDRKPCISSLNELAKNLDNSQIEKITDLLISYEYNDTNVKKISNPHTSNERFFLKKKRKENISFENDLENLKLENKSQVQFNNFNLNGARKFHRNSINSKNNINLFNERTNSINENYLINGISKESINDDFKDHFYNVFNAGNRRLSFEDNLLYLFTSYQQQQNASSIKEVSTYTITEGSGSGEPLSISLCESSCSEEDDESFNEDEDSSWIDNVMDLNKSYLIV